MKGKSLQTFAVVVLAGALLATSACGGSADNSYGYGPVVVLTATPNTVCGPTPTAITIGGMDFSEIIGDGTEGLPVPETTVTFIAVSPIFLGGTADRVDVAGQITSATTVLVTTPAAVVCGAAGVQARVRVTLPSGVFAESGNILTFLAPVIGPLTAAGGGSIFPAAIPTPYTIGVNQAGPGGCNLALWAGQTVHVHWLTDAGNPPLFGGSVTGGGANPFVGTSADITTPATINAAGNIEGISPPAVVCQPGAAVPYVITATIDHVTFPDGSCTAPANTLATGFRAPSITSITNDSGQVPHNGLSEFAAALPESFHIVGADFGPSGGSATVVFTEPGGLPVFEGGTTSTTTVQADITGPTTIDGISPPAAICGVTSMAIDVAVILPEGSCTPNTAPSTFFAPDFVSILNTDANSAGSGTNHFEAALPSSFVITGQDFGPVGGAVGVRFTSSDGDLLFDVDGNLNPTNTFKEVVGTIVDRTHVVGTSPEGTLCDPLAPGAGAQSRTENMDLQVLLEGGSCTLATDPESLTAAVYDGPTLATIEATFGTTTTGPGAGAATVLFPSTLPLAVTDAGTFVLKGTGFGPLGTSAQVTLTATNPIFAGGTQTTTTLDGTIVEVQDQLTITGTLPTIDMPRLTADEIISVSVTLVPNGSCAHWGQMFTFRAPPTITTIANLDAGLGNGFLAATVGTDFLGCVSSTMQVTGTAFAATGGADPETTTTIYDKTSGVDPLTKVPVRRLGQDPTLFPAGNDLGLPVNTPTYAVTATTITGETRLDTGLATLDTDHNGLVTFTVRVVNPVDGQFNESDVTFHVWTPAVDVSNNTANTNNNVSVAIDPTSVVDDFADGSTTPDATNGGNASVVANNDATDVGFFDANDIFYANTIDGGHNWSNSTIGAANDGLGSGLEYRTHAQVVWGQSGQMYVLYLINDPLDFTGGPFGTSYIEWVASQDGGQTFWASGIAYTTQLGFIDRLDVSVGPNPGNPGLPDQVLYSWVDSTLLLQGLNEEVRVQRLYGTLGTVSWFPGAFFTVSDPGKFFGATGQRVDAECALGPSGEWHVMWTEFDFLTASSVVLYDVDRDGPGATYTFGQDQSVLQNSALALPIPAQPDFFSLPQKDMVVIPTGTNAGRVVYALEKVTPLANGGQTLQVVAGFTDDYGQNFATIGTVHPTNSGSQFNPALCADPTNGAVYATWYDSANDAAGGFVAVERFSARSDNGILWGNPLLLSATPSVAGTPNEATDYGLYQGVAAYGNCVLAGWAENTTGNGANFMDATVRAYSQTADSQP